MYVFAPRPHVIPFMNQREEEITMSTYAFNDAGQYTVFENRRKSRIQPCERSELDLHFEQTKIN